MLGSAGTDRVLKLPYRGAPQTVSVIQDSALKSQDHIQVRQLTESVCEGVRSKDYLSEILAINNFVWASTRYMRDPRTVELVYAPYLVVAAISKGRTPSLDCDDLAAVIAAMLLSAGCETRVVTVAFVDQFYNGQRQFSHVFAQGREPRTGTWVTCDPVAGKNTRSMLRRVKAAKTWPIA